MTSVCGACSSQTRSHPGTGGAAIQVCAIGPTLAEAIACLHSDKPRHEPHTPTRDDRPGGRAPTASAPAFTQAGAAFTCPSRGPDVSAHAPWPPHASGVRGFGFAHTQAPGLLPWHASAFGFRFSFSLDSTYPFVKQPDLGLEQIDDADQVRYRHPQDVLIGSFVGDHRTEVVDESTNIRKLTHFTVVFRRIFSVLNCMRLAGRRRRWRRRDAGDVAPAATSTAPTAARIPARDPVDADDD